MFVSVCVFVLAVNMCKQKLTCRRIEITKFTLWRIIISSTAMVFQLLLCHTNVCTNRAWVIMDLLNVVLHHNYTFKILFTMFALDLCLNSIKLYIIINFQFVKLYFCLFSLSLDLFSLNICLFKIIGGFFSNFLMF